jgi:hypothetical protein
MYGIMRGSLGILGLAFALTAFADAPPSIKVPDTHSTESHGIITLYRVQLENVDLGQGKDQIKAEVFITLDSTKDLVYYLQLGKGAPPVNTVMADTLREAYLHKEPVTLYSQKLPQNAPAVKLYIVQMDRR